MSERDSITTDIVWGICDQTMGHQNLHPANQGGDYPCVDWRPSLCQFCGRPSTDQLDGFKLCAWCYGRLRYERKDHPNV